MEPIKEKLLAHCKHLINDRVATLQQSIKEFQEAANEDAKSSMGDKYETNRAMMHLEKEKASTQLNQLIKMKQLLDGLRVEKGSEKVTIGSLVATEKNQYFISIGLGPIQFDGETYLVISAASPIGQLLMGKKAEDTFEFRGASDKILTVH